MNHFLLLFIAVLSLLSAIGCATTKSDGMRVIDLTSGQTTPSPPSTGKLERAGDVPSDERESNGGGVLQSVGLARDTDGDGITDDMDKCPDEPEDRDGFQDDDGCSDGDNDHDSILDINDQCPNEPETLNGFQDEDGCPDTTNTDQAKLAYRAAVTAYAQGDYATARKYFEAAYRFDPRDPLLFNLARTAEKQNDRKGACQYYRQWRATPTGTTTTDSIATLETCP